MAPPLLIEYECKPLLLLVLAGVLMFVSPFDYQELVSLPFLRTPAAVVGLLLSLAFALLVLPHYQLYRGPQVWLLFLVVGTLLTQLIRLAAGDEPQLRFYLQWIQVFILFAILLDIARDPRSLPILWGSVVAAAIFMAILGLVSGIESNSGRSGVAEVNLNRQAHLYILGLLTLFWWLIEKWRNIRIGQLFIVLAGALLLLLAVLKTASRGGFMAMVAGGAMLLLLEARKRNTSAYVYLLPCLILLSISVVSSNDMVIDRWLKTFYGEEDNSRLDIWDWALYLIAQRPWVGQGPSFMNVLGNHYELGRVISTHNAYLQVAIAYGIPVFLLWLGLVVGVLRRCWRVRYTPAGALLISALVVTLLMGVSGDLAFNRYFWLILALSAQANIYQLSVNSNISYLVPTILQRRH